MSLPESVYIGQSKLAGRPAEHRPQTLDVGNQNSGGRRHLVFPLSSLLFRLSTLALSWASSCEARPLLHLIGLRVASDSQRRPCLAQLGSVRFGLAGMESSKSTKPPQQSQPIQMTSHSNCSCSVKCKSSPASSSFCRCRCHSYCCCWLTGRLYLCRLIRPPDASDSARPPDSRPLST